MCKDQMENLQIIDKYMYKYWVTGTYIVMINYNVVYIDSGLDVFYRIHMSKHLVYHLRVLVLQRFVEYEEMLERIVAAMDPLLESIPVYLPHIRSDSGLKETWSQLPAIKSFLQCGNTLFSCKKRCKNITPMQFMCSPGSDNVFEKLSTM